MGGNNSPAATAMIFSGANRTGQVRMMGTGDGTARYDAMTPAEVIDNGLEFDISSASIFFPSVGGGSLIMYANGPVSPGLGGLGGLGPLGGMAHFTGQFIQFTNNQSGDTLNVNLSGFSFGGGTWDNAPTSLILAHGTQGPEFRISCRQTLTPIWNNFLDQQLAGSQAPVVRNGNPRFSWVPFPQGIQFLNPNKHFIRVKQKLIVSTGVWFLGGDYKASMTYFINLRVSNGQLTGAVNRWETWVEGGVLTEAISDQLSAKVDAGADQLTALIQNGTLFPNVPPLASIYFLPGTQTDPSLPGAGTVAGTNGPDATIILQLPQ